MTSAPRDAHPGCGLPSPPFPPQLDSHAHPGGPFLEPSLSLLTPFWLGLLRNLALSGIKLLRREKREVSVSQEVPEGGGWVSPIRLGLPEGNGGVSPLRLGPPEGKALPRLWFCTSPPSSLRRQGSYRPGRRRWDQGEAASPIWPGLAQPVRKSLQLPLPPRRPSSSSSVTLTWAFITQQCF